MEHASCNVIYVDRRVTKDRCLRAADGSFADSAEWESEHLSENLRHLVDFFEEVHLCRTGGACLSQWLDLQDTSMMDLRPTLILIDTPFDDRIPSRPRSREPSPRSPAEEDGGDQEGELYGMGLLRRIVSESYLRNLSKLVVPVPVIHFPGSDRSDRSDSSVQDPREAQELDKTNNGGHWPKSRQAAASRRRMVKKCLDLGATDIMSSPMNARCMSNLEVHSYRAHREAAREQKALLEVRRGRKRSWVGIGEEKPFAYLREAMVSGLMSRICRVDDPADAVPIVRVSLSAEKQARITKAVGEWYFCAHDFSDDELVVAAAVMFKHALSVPALEQWRIPADQLCNFILACRASYNDFVPYHNFRHVVDVLQATFNFLVHIGALPPMDGSTPPLAAKSPMAALLGPFEALTLLITAIGHDVGHPGVNNGFLVTLKAPLAQLYNDRSVLESFHCAAYSQILRRYWPAAFGDAKMRSLLISSILATDMALHFDYMKKMKVLRDKLHEHNGIDHWKPQMVEEQTSLMCALLIKCADISNVARQYGTAVEWMNILSDEFSRQATIESELEIRTSLMSPPKKDLLSMVKAQLGFMNIFAIPLFREVAELVPSMQYCVDELDLNKRLFDDCVAHEQAQIDRGETPTQRDMTGTMRAPATTAPRTDASTLQHQKNGVPSLASQNRALAEEDTGNQPHERAEKTPHIQAMSREYKEANGMATNFDPVADFALSDPFNTRGLTKQRCSETTEGSSAPCSGDWISQATSAATSKMPVTPSTKGTSIVSRDSMEHLVSAPAIGVPVTTVTGPELSSPALKPIGSRAELRLNPDFLSEDEAAVNGHARNKPKAPDAEVESERTLKKKPSRFRINALPFFRRHKTPSPPLRAADAAG